MIRIVRRCKAMSKYTTGEIARLCGVTVRTVQYYDRRNILIPSELSEGGRRLYSEDDLRRMKLICYLRGLDLPIDSIAQLLADGNSREVITLLLSQQEESLRQELKERQEKLSSLEQLSKELKSLGSVSLESISDIAFKMANNNKLNRTHALMLALGILMDLVGIGTLIYGVVKHIWWPFAAGMALVVAMGIWISRFYFKSVAYICPQCHQVFKPRFREAFFARHTPKLRRLTCPHCGVKSFCIETYSDISK